MTEELADEFLNNAVAILSQAALLAGQFNFSQANQILGALAAEDAIADFGEAIEPKIHAVQTIAKSLIHLNEAIAYNASRQPAKAKAEYQHIRDLLRTRGETLNAFPEFEVFTFYVDLTSSINLHLAAATEEIFLGNPIEAHRHIKFGGAELNRAFNEFGIDLKSGQIGTDNINPRAGLVAIQAIDYVLLEGIVRAQHVLTSNNLTRDAQEAEEIEVVSDALISIIQTSGQIEHLALFKALALITKTFTEIVRGFYLTARDDFEGALRSGNRSRENLDQTLRFIAMSANPNAKMIQDVAYNMQSFLIPQTEARWKREAELKLLIRKLDAEVANLRSQQRELLNKLGVSQISFNSIQEQRTAIDNKIAVTNRFVDHAIKEAGAALDKLAEESPQNGPELRRLGKEIKSAVTLESAAEKIEAVKRICDASDTVIQSVLKAAPHLKPLLDMAMGVFS